jgi:hypothetical protein
MERTADLVPPEPRGWRAAASSRAAVSGERQSRHHSWTIVPISHRPKPLGVPRPASHGPLSGPGPEGISPSGITSPHAVAGKTSPPQAANSHSASEGSRQRLSSDSESHSQKAIASFQVTPTTGWSGDEKSASLHHGGAAARPHSTNGAYSRFVTGVLPRLKAAPGTACTMIERGSRTEEDYGFLGTSLEFTGRRGRVGGPCNRPGGRQ